MRAARFGRIVAAVLWLSLCTLAAPAWAQQPAPRPTDAPARWIAVGGTDRADVYLDTATLERRARLRSVWLLHDLRQTDADGDRSWRVQVEYDCAHAIYRTLQVLFHAEPMGRGRPRGRSAEPGPWRAAEADSLNGQVMRRLCDAPAR